jgi:hypothetical protein
MAAETKGSKLVDLLARAVRAGSSGGKRNNANAILVDDRTASSVATVGEKRATGSRARAREREPPQNSSARADRIRPTNFVRKERKRQTDGERGGEEPAGHQDRSLGRARLRAVSFRLLLPLPLALLPMSECVESAVIPFRDLWNR